MAKRAPLGVTFDRTRALSREDISFVSWDHPMVTGAIDMVLSSGTGSASFGILRGTGAPGILLEVLFVLETIGGQELHVDRFLPNTPLRVVVDHTGRMVTDLYPVETLDQQLTKGSMDHLLDNEEVMNTLLPQMISAAAEIAETLSTKEVSMGLKKMGLTLDHEIDRLQVLHKNDKHIRPEEIELAMKERTTLTTLIKDARIRMDALLLVQKGSL